MRRRDILAAGSFALATPIVSSTATGEFVTGGVRRIPEEVATGTYDEPGHVVDLSTSAETAVFGFDDGNVKVFDDERDGDVLQLEIDRSVSHVQVQERANAAGLAWIDAETFAFLDLQTDETTVVEYDGMWDIDTTSGAEFIAAVTQPTEGIGSVALADDDGVLVWEAPLNDATGWSVAVTDDREFVAVAAGAYFEGDVEPTGTPSVSLYGEEGTEVWRHTHDEDVTAVEIDANREFVAAGTDDGSIIVLDFAGEVVWETDAYGGEIDLSADGSSILTWDVDEGFLALETETGDERWSVDIGIMPSEYISISDDGSRALGADRLESEIVVVEEGEVIWTESYEDRSVAGALSGDGDDWAALVSDLDEGTSDVEIFRDNEDTDPAPDDDPDVEMTTVVDFDWSYPDCPNKEADDLDEYFFGDVAEDDGFHIDDGSGAREEPDSCVLRTDGEEVAIHSLPDDTAAQPETFDTYPQRGATIRFEHYVHRDGANMAFHFGVQEDAESYYAVELLTDTDPPVVAISRVDDDEAIELEQVTDPAYATGEWHAFEIEWLEEAIAVSLDGEDETTTVTATDDTYDQGGIGFYKENAGVVRSYAHLWNDVEVVTESEADPDGGTEEDS